MGCPFEKEKVSALHDGELLTAERSGVEEHLAGCGECQAYLADLKGMSNLFGQLPIEKSPDTVVQGVSQGIANPDVRPSLSRFRKPLGWGFAAAASVMICLFVVKIARPPAHREELGEAASQVHAPSPLANVDVHRFDKEENPADSRQVLTARVAKADERAKEAPGLAGTPAKAVDFQRGLMQPNEDGSPTLGFRSAGGYLEKSGEKQEESAEKKEAAEWLVYHTTVEDPKKTGTFVEEALRRQDVEFRAIPMMGQTCAYAVYGVLSEARDNVQSEGRPSFHEFNLQILHLAKSVQPRFRTLNSLESNEMNSFDDVLWAYGMLRDERKEPSTDAMAQLAAPAAADPSFEENSGMAGRKRREERQLGKPECFIVIRRKKTLEELEKSQNPAKSGE